MLLFSMFVYLSDLKNESGALAVLKSTLNVYDNRGASYRLNTMG